ncbi:MAG: hypothetical protein AW07_01531 [Candidatus Accumulibacter sp. SK-11]|nr:MAG: hypothetical protein AW07_01531 [Candidatus Accumulibacter sp. SK-11]
MKLAPSARAMPAPPSFVALPPMPMMIRRSPQSSAARISSPVPKVVVSRGSRWPGASSGSPDAAAISTTAVVPSPRIPHCASTGARRGPLTRVWRSVPPVAPTRAATVPSPPSAIGTLRTSASGKTSRMPRSIASATPTALRLPLNESGATTMRKTIPPRVTTRRSLGMPVGDRGTGEAAALQPRMRADWTSASKRPMCLA